MKVNTNVKSGDWHIQHNEKLTSERKYKDFIIKTGVKAGTGDPGNGGNNHNEKLESDKSRTLVVKTNIKAGLLPAV